MFLFINVHTEPQLLTSPQDQSLPIYFLMTFNSQQRLPWLKWLIWFRPFTEGFEVCAEGPPEEVTHEHPCRQGG